MSFNQHRNATPNKVFTGVKDNPRPGPDTVRAAFGNFTVFNPIFANWGPLDDSMAVSDRVVGERVFGSEAFDIAGPYYNYQTALATMLMQRQAAQFLTRVADMATVKKAGARLLLEYVLDDIDPKNRNADGTFALDSDGNPVDTGATIEGYRVRLLVEQSDGTMVVGDGAQVAGSLVGKAPSVILPICDLEATYYGTRGNRFLASLFQPKTNNPNVVDADSIEAKGSMIYRMGFRESKSGGGSTTPWYNVNGGDTIDFSLQPGLIDINETVIDFEERYETGYKKTNQLTNSDNLTGPVDGIYWYDDNIETVLGLLLTKEVDARPSEGDNTIWIDDTNPYSINLFGATNHHNVPYRAIVHADLTDAATDSRQVVLSGGAALIGLAGGDDGDMSNAAFNQSVGDMADNFGNGIPLGDILQYPFHWIFDMGLDTDVTEKLYKITAIRPDVIVVGSTHVHGRTATMDETANRAANIMSEASLIPESVLYSTPMSRGAIVPFSIKIKNSRYRKPISLAYDLAEKLADYLSAGNLVWRTHKDPLHKDNKDIQHQLLDYQYSHYTMRERLWQSQCVALESTGHGTVGYIGMQSMNPNDSSVLNSLITMAGVVQTTWAMATAYAQWFGGQMPEATLISRCNTTISELTSGMHAEKVTVTPNTQVTQQDRDNGFSASLMADLQAGPQFTAATIGIESSFFQG